MDERAAYTPFTRNAERAFAPIRPADARTALVVLDTNVLLAPYRTSSAALAEIRRVYESLKKAKRLVVPGEVAREFARNRPARLAELYKAVRNASSAQVSGKHSLPAVVQGLAESAVAKDELKRLHATLQSYQAALNKMAAEVAGWTRTDPVLDIYSTLFDASVVVECAHDSVEIEKIRKPRYASKIPPGYEDEAKADGGRGDLAIWLTILEVAKARDLDAIFVSDDRKRDWAHSFDADHVVWPRFELVAEFAEATSGKNFELMSLASLLERLESPSDVVAEVRRQELHPSGDRLKLQFRTLLFDAAGRGLAEIRSTSASHLDLTEAGRTTSIDVRTIRYATESRLKGYVAQLGEVDSTIAERVVLVIAAEDNSAQWFVSQFADAPSPPTVQLIVVRPIESGFVTLVNHSTSPILKDTFSVGLERVD